MFRRRIAIVDNHPTVLFALGDLLGHDIRLNVVASFRNPADLIAYLRKDEMVDIIITDYSMPDENIYGDGVKYIRYLARNFPGKKIMVFASLKNPTMIFSLYDYGVAAVVLKTHDMSEINIAVQAVCDGRVYYPPGINREDLRSFSEHMRSISPKEMEVLRHFARGATLKRIASDLNRSIKTVSTQKRSVMKKLNIATDQLLMEYCLSTNLF